MKKSFSIILTMVMLLSALTACAAAPKETEPAEPAVTAQIVKEGATEYVIVHDGSVEAEEFAGSLDSLITAFLGVDMQVFSAQEQPEAVCEIIVGNCRASGEQAAKNLTGLYDFSMTVQENKLALCAKDKLSYSFLTEYLKREIFANAQRGAWTMTSEQNIVYSQSNLKEESYIDYWLQAYDHFAYKDHFASGVYQNADTTIPYRIYVPFNYDPAKQYPLLLSLHGASERGNDNVRQLSLINLALDNKALEVDEAIIIYPQCPVDNKWVDTSWAVGSYSLDAMPESNELKAVLELLEEIKKTYSVDENRQYVIGLSMGGYGTWNLLMNHPDMFAGAVPMCSGGDPTKASVIKDIPIWAVHGALDSTVPVEGSRLMANALQAAGAKDFHYTEIPNANHDVWTYTFSNTEIFLWLFSQQKGQ